MSFVRLATPLSFSAARSIVAALNGQGIHAFMGNEHSGHIYASSVVGGFPIYVGAADLEQAREYLQTVEREWAKEHVIADDPNAGPQCPLCGGGTRVRTSEWLAGLANFAVKWLGFPVPSKRRECTDCGHVWRPGGREPFTPEELGYDPDGPVEGDFISRIRSIGYEHMPDKEEPHP
jgi:hypothetical protein